MRAADAIRLLLTRARLHVHLSYFEHRCLTKDVTADRTTVGIASSAEVVVGTSDVALVTEHDLATVQQGRVTSIEHAERAPVLGQFIVV